MSKHLIQGFITWHKYPWETEARIGFSQFDPSEVASGEYAACAVRPYSFEVDVSDDFDPNPQRVAALQAEKQKVRADFAKRITELDTQISKLLAITNEVAEA